VIYSVCVVNRSQALRGRNLTRDSQAEGASRTHQASGIDCMPEAVLLRPFGRPRHAWKILRRSRILVGPRSPSTQDPDEPQKVPIVGSR
jgi:hypothetical protein